MKENTAVVAKESRAARQIPLKFFRLLNMKSIFVSLSFRDFFSLFRRRENGETQ